MSKVLVACNCLRNGYRFHARFPLQGIVESPQKLAPGFGIVFPRIFAIKDHRDHSVAPLRQYRLRRVFDIAKQMDRSLGRGHPGVDKTDQVGQGVVAEDQVHRRLAVLIAVDVVQPPGQIRRQAPVAIAREKHACAGPEHAFIRRHPLNSQTVGDGQHFFRHTAFRRPDALGPHTENLLVKIEGAHQLLARILGVTIAVLGQWQSGRRHGAGIGIAQQGKNGVIEGRGRDFHRSLLRGVGIRRQNLAQQFSLAYDHKLLIFQRVIAAFLHQRGHVLVFQEKLVEPGDLREHLQIGQVPRLEIFLRPLWRIAILAKSLAQFLIAGIASDQVRRIGLK